jgi:hypothetical protein
MSKAVPISITKAVIYPINSQNEYTYLKGNPIINFQIAPQNAQRLLDTKTLRLNFKLKYYNATPTTYVNNDGAYDASSAEYTAQVNPRIGNSCIIDLVRLRNYKNEIISELRNYSRSLATIYPITNSMASYRNKLSVSDGATALQLAQNRGTNTPRSMSLKLQCGLFLNETKLSLDQIGGLKLDVILSSDSMVFNNTKIGGTTSTDMGYFALSDVNLSWNYINLSQPLPPSNQPISYPQMASYTQIINSSNDSKSINLNLQSVNGAFQNFILSSRINNWAKDSYETPKLKNTNDDERVSQRILEVAHMRNAMKYPLKYTINQRRQVEFNAFEAHLHRNFINTVKSYNKIDNSLVSAYTQGLWGYDKTTGSDDGYNGGFATATVKSNVSKGDLKPIWGVGVKYDSLNRRMGGEFKNSYFQERIESTLDGVSPNTAYLFCLSNQQLLTKGTNVRPIQ